MPKLKIRMKVTEFNSSNSFFQFSHEILYLKAGPFAGQYLSYDDPAVGYISDWGKVTNAFKPLYNAIYNTNLLSFIMPSDQNIENAYRNHATLDKVLNPVSIDLYSDAYPWAPFNSPPPTESVGIWDVTISPSILKTADKSVVVMYYNGATKIWF